MNAIVNRAELSGSVNAIPSKSFLHRILIAAALSDRPTEIRGMGESNDVLATVSCLRALGAKIVINGDKATVSPLNPTKTAVLNCGESGSTLRFMLPVAAAVGGDYTFTGRGRLVSRPNGPLLDALKKRGVKCEGDGLPLKISGKLQGEEFSVDGSVSSQYLTGLMLAAPLLGGARIKVEGDLKSKDYINITTEVLTIFGVSVKCEGDVYEIKGGYRTPGTVTAEGDWSNAAFMLAGGLFTGETHVLGLDPESVQGDRRIVDVFRSFGGDIECRSVTAAQISAPVSSDKTALEEQKVAFIAKKSRLFAAKADLSDLIDAAPVLAVTAALSEGESEFYGVERLRFKESDRLDAIIKTIVALGGNARTDGRTLYIRGGLKGGEADGFNDHRMVMSLFAAGAAVGPIYVKGTEAVNKSYPSFLTDYKSLGGDYIVKE